MTLDHKEYHLVKSAVITQQEGLHFLNEILAIGQEINTLQRHIIRVTSLYLLVEADHVGL